MQNEPLNFDQSLFEAELAELIPSGAAINRDALMFEAGQVEAGRKTKAAGRRWASLCGMLVCVSLVQTGLLFSSNETEVPIANHTTADPQALDSSSLVIDDNQQPSGNAQEFIEPVVTHNNFKPGKVVENSNAWFRSHLLISGNPAEEAESTDDPASGSVLPITRTHRQLLNELLQG